MRNKWNFYKDHANEWRWHKKAANGKIVGASPKGYKNKADCLDNAKRHGYKD